MQSSSASCARCGGNSRWAGGVPLSVTNNGKVVFKKSICDKYLLFYFYIHSLEEKNLLLFFWKARRMLFLAVLHLRCCLTRSCVIALFSDFTRSTGREMSLQQGTIPVFLYFFCQWALPQQASRCISGTQIQHQHHIRGGCLKPFYLSVARVRDPGSSSINGGFQFFPWFPWQPVQKPSPKKNATQWEQRHQVCIFLWGIVLNDLCYSDNFWASCKKQKPRTGWWQK